MRRSIPESKEKRREGGRAAERGTAGWVLL